MFSKMVAVGDGSVGSLTVQLGDVSGGINIINIDGLDPVKATLTSSNFAGQAGAIFQSSHRETRNITMKFGIEPNPATQTVRSVRNSIYNIFREGTQILLKFYDDESTDVSDGYQIYGRVETCEPPTGRFAQEPEVDISILCFDPDFFDPEVIRLTDLTTADTTATSIDYVGTAETGMMFTVNINATISEFQIYYTDGNSITSTMNVAASFLAGDTVTIITTPGSKSASLFRAGVTTSILYAISPQSVWPQLAPGTNLLRFSADGSMPAAISYTKRFGRV